MRILAKLLTLGLVLASFAIPQQLPMWVITSIPDVAGTGSAVQLASSGTCRWVQLVAPKANTNDVRVGGSDVSSSKGITLAAATGFMFPTSPNGGSNAPLYSLSSIWVLVQSGDKVTGLCGN